MNRLSFVGTICLAFVLTVLVAIGSPAKTRASIITFSNSQAGTLVQGFNGNFYGTTTDGGQFGYGTVFEITPKGKLMTLYSFCSKANCADGAYPAAGLLQAANGMLYGTTYYGGTGPTDYAYPYNGAPGRGTLFEISPAGSLTTIHNFCTQPACADGANPDAAPVQLNDGSIYGITIGATPQTTWWGGGVLFKITPAGQLAPTFLGDSPNLLALAPDGNGLYGTKAYARSAGVIWGFEGGKEFTFEPSCQIGCPPVALVQTASGNFFGTTAAGGPGGAGTIFEISMEGEVILLNRPGGYAPLIQASDGNIYAVNGGSEITTQGQVIPVSGKESTLYTFCSQSACIDGESPQTGFIQGTDGKFYGTVAASTDGSLPGYVYSFDAGLRPFVKTLPMAGSIGASVAILGNNLLNSTNVTFNGTPAGFRVVSSTVIRAAVPAGATTGPVQVTTPTRTLTSNTNFEVN